MAEIEQWWADWQTRSGDQQLNTTEQFIHDLNMFTDWVARRADPAEIDQQSDALLTAILDLRQIVVRKLSQTGPNEDDG